MSGGWYRQTCGSQISRGLVRKDHILTTDNYFKSTMALFTELVTMDIYASRTMMCNPIGLPKELKNLNNWTNTLQGTIRWCMHESGGMCCVIWKDKSLFLLISTSAIPIQVPCIHPRHIMTRPRRNGTVKSQFKLL